MAKPLENLRMNALIVDLSQRERRQQSVCDSKIGERGSSSFQVFAPSLGGALFFARRDCTAQFYRIEIGRLCLRSAGRRVCGKNLWR